MMPAFPLCAESPAETAFLTGRFEDAYQFAASEEESADRLAFQARSLLAQAIFQGEQPEAELLNSAESLSAKALSLDASHQEARMQLAIAISMKSRVMSLREIGDRGYDKLTRGLANDVLEADPDNAWAHGFLSVWHIEARRMAGMFLAGMVGASLEDAETHYQAAVDAQPDNLVIKWQYAPALMAFKPKKYRDEIATLLSEVCGAQPADALEETVQTRAERFRMLMTSEDFDHIKSQAQTTL